jgi:hypothetical protein
MRLFDVGDRHPWPAAARLGWGLWSIMLWGFGLYCAGCAGWSDRVGNARRGGDYLPAGGTEVIEMSEMNVGGAQEVPAQLDRGFNEQFYPRFLAVWNKHDTTDLATMWRTTTTPRSRGNSDSYPRPAAGRRRYSSPCNASKLS